MDTVAAFAIALAGNACLSLGMVLQKRNIAFVGHRGPRDAAWKKTAIGWIVGFVLMNAAPVFNYLALLGLPANIVAAAVGSNVAFTALFSAPLLGERLSLRALLLTALMFVAIAFAGLRGASGTTEGVEGGLLFLFLALPALLLGFALLRRRSRPSARLAILIGGIAGSFGGFMILPMKAIQVLVEPNAAAWLASPFFYAYIVAGVCAFSIVQLAYKDGRMTSVSPAYYGMQMLWPALASYFVLGAPFDVLQAAAFVLVAACIALMAGEGSPATPTTPATPETPTPLK